MSNNLPLMVELEPGTSYWCSCGRSSKVPFCDGSHEGTEKVPIEFTVIEKKKMGLCQCQRTKKPPLCDGTHARVD
jgi:CDGSH-type Zn-finger protein